MTATERLAVISKRSLLFIEPAKPGQKPGDARQCLLKASPVPQPLPEWVLALPAFERALAARVVRTCKIAAEVEE